VTTLALPQILRAQSSEDTAMAKGQMRSNKEKRKPKKNDDKKAKK
jgi:hypothetical protein